MENNRQTYICNLVTYVGYYLKNGIVVEGRKMPFTALDYYSIVKDNMFDVATEVRAMMQNHINVAYKNYFFQFANNNGLAFNQLKDISKVMAEHNAFIINDRRVEPTEEDVQEIFDLLDSYNIPKYEKVVYTALTRKAFGYPILPFVNVEEQEKTMSR